MTTSRKSSSGRDEGFKSKWPYFQSLEFLRDSVTPRKTKVVCYIFGMLHITTYLKYTFPYFLKDLVYRWNSANCAEMFSIIFVSLYCDIWTSVSSLLLQRFKNVFSFLHFPGLFCQVSVDSISHVSVGVYQLGGSVFKMLCKIQLAKTFLALFLELQLLNLKNAEYISQNTKRVFHYATCTA